MSVALVIQHSRRLRRNTLASLPLPYFSTLSHKRHDFGKQKLCYWTQKCLFWFSVKNFVWNISHSKKNWVRYYHKCTHFLMWSTRYTCQIFTKLLIFSTYFFEKYSNTKFHKNPSRENRFVPCGLSYRHDEAFAILRTPVKNWILSKYCP